MNFLAIDFTLNMLWEPAVYVLVGFFMIIFGKLFYKLVHPKINVNSEMVDKDNLAFAISQIGYYVGLILAISGALYGEAGHDFGRDILASLAYGGCAIVLLNIGIFLNDKLILSAFNVRDEIVNKLNVGTGVVEAGNSIANGMIIFGALAVEGDDPFVAFAFWGIGQAAIVIAAWIYRMLMSYDVHDYVKRGNVAVGIAFAGALIGIANLIRFALETVHTDWMETMSYLGIELFLGFVLLPVVRLLTDKLLLPGRKLTDELVNQEKPNIGAGMVEAFAYIGGSFLIIWAI